MLTFGADINVAAHLNRRCLRSRTVKWLSFARSSVNASAIRFLRAASSAIGDVWACGFSSSFWPIISCRAMERLESNDNLPVRRDNLSPAISPLKYDFDAISEARALVRSGFQTEIADKEPFEIRMSAQDVGVQDGNLLKFRSLSLISLPKRAAKDAPSSVTSLEAVT